MKHLLIVLIVVCSLGLLFHPGRTDEDGGHTDHSTGEYHYHHGYPAHQHPNGKCPYEDQEPIYTHHNSGSSKSFTPTPTYASTPVPTSTSVQRNTVSSQASEKSSRERPLDRLIGSLIAAVLNIVLAFVCYKNKNAGIGTILLLGGLAMLWVFFITLAA